MTNRSSSTSTSAPAMKPDSKQLGVIGHNIVIDNGTNTVKGGFSTADAPQCRIPTLVGHGRHKVRTSLDSLASRLLLLLVRK